MSHPRARKRRFKQRALIAWPATALRAVRCKTGAQPGGQTRATPRRHGFVVSTTVAAFLAFVAASIRAEDWQPLFNGRDLAGWQVVGKPADCWSGDDGILQPTKKGGWLATEKEFSDFELELEFWLAPGSNSGLFLRSPLQGQSSRVGMEIQLIDDFTTAFGKLEPWQLSGSLYHVQAARPGAALPAEQWQTLHVRCVGRQLTVHLNEKPVLDVNLDGYPELAAEHPGLKRTRGHLGLQNYGGRDIRFRNLRLREIR